MLNNHPVKTEDANRVFEVLTSEARLNILKLLVKHSADGLPAGGGITACGHTQDQSVLSSQGD